MPTGSNRTTCLSAMAPSRGVAIRSVPGHLARSFAGRERRAEGLGLRPSFLALPPASRAGRRSAVGGREAAGRAAADVARVVGHGPFRGHLVGQAVGAPPRWATAQA